MVDTKNVKPDKVKLREILKKYNLSKADLINKAGLPSKTGYRIFDGGSSVRLDNLKKLLEPLGLDAKNFVQSDNSDNLDEHLQNDAIIFDAPLPDAPTFHLKIYRSEIPSEKYLPVKYHDSVRFKIKVYLICIEYLFIGSS